MNVIDNKTILPPVRDMEILNPLKMIRNTRLFTTFDKYF